MCTICSLNPLNEFNGGHEIVTNPTSIGESSGEILGSTSYSFVGATSDQNTNGLLSGYKWTSTTLTYSFPNSINDYGSSDAAFHGSSFSQFDAAQQAATKYWLDEFASVSGLTFIEYTGGLDDDAVLKFANGNASTAFAYYPNSTARAGDSWYGPFTQDPIMGNYDWHTLGHEIGHTVGLKHGHESNVFGAMQYAYDSNEYSIMTYRSYVGHAADFYELGSTSGAQSLMVYDIAALQHMYGANYSTNSGNTTYQFSTSTGQLYINGVAQQDGAGNKIFRTIWDGSGIDHYDFSNFSTQMQIDLNPGAYIDLDVNGNSYASYLGDGNYTDGQVYNALMYNGNTASLIENATGGSNSDTIVGNQIANELTGGGGADKLYGNGGKDVLNGSFGNDDLWGGNDNDTLNGGEGADELWGEKGLDKLFGDGGNDKIYGGAGRDFAKGGTGNDEIWGGTDDDKLYGEENNDTLHGDAGEDELYGGDGNDNIYGGEDSDKIGGNDGVDYIEAGTGNDTVWGGSGDDDIFGQGDNDELKGGNGDDEIDGGTGDDAVFGGGDEDILKGGDGKDKLNGGSENDQLYGGLNNDTLIGGTGVDTLYGDGWFDKLYGGNDGDFLYGGDGNDLLKGQDGNDLLAGETGNDRMYGGTGVDTFVFTPSLETGDADTIYDFEIDVDVIRALGITFAGVTISDAGEDTLVSFGTSSVTLENVDHALLTEDHFEFGALMAPYPEEYLFEI